jgi:hypothetical protein
MYKKFFGFFLGLLGFIAQTASGLILHRPNEHQSEIDRIWKNLSNNKSSHEATLLYPRSSIANQRFLFLAAHGSHVSHASHASHVSHVSGASHKSGSSCQVYTPIPQQLTSGDIIGFKDSRFSSNSGSPLVLYLPNSSLNHLAINYQVLHKPMYGTVKTMEDGRIIYTPNLGYTGLDSFSVYASDGNTQTEPVLFSVDVK